MPEKAYTSNLLIIRKVINTFRKVAGQRCFRKALSLRNFYICNQCENSKFIRRIILKFRYESFVKTIKLVKGQLQKMNRAELLAIADSHTDTFREWQDCIIYLTVCSSSTKFNAGLVFRKIRLFIADSQKLFPDIKLKWKESIESNQDFLTQSIGQLKQIQTEIGE